MLKLEKILITLFVFLAIFFGYNRIAMAEKCPIDNGFAGCDKNTTPYYCTGNCRSASLVPQCPEFINGDYSCDPDAPGCGVGCTSADDCGICDECDSDHLLCSQTNGAGKNCAPLGIAQGSQVSSYCTACTYTYSGGNYAYTCTNCQSGYVKNGSQCVQAVLKLGPDSVSGNNIVQSVANTLMYINGDQVNIGTSSFATGTKLYLYDVASGPIIALSGLDSNYRGLTIKNTNDIEQWFIGNNNSNNFVIRATGSNDILTVNFSTSNVGIGTTTSDAKLDVNGSLAVRGAVSFTGPSYIGDGNRLLMVDNEGNVSATTTAGGGGNYVLKSGDIMSGTLHFETSTDVAINANQNNIIGVNKLSVVIIDPLYDIGGVKYSSYAPSIVGGVKEEYVGRGNIKNCGSEFCSWILDFSQVSKGSDLWVWRQIIDFRPETIEVIMTAYGQPALLSYEIGDNQIKFHSDRPTQFSYRLVGSRFDWRRWPTLAPDQFESTSLIIK